MFLVGGEKLAPGNSGDITVVTPSPDFEMRREQDVEMESAQEVGVAL